MSTIDVTLPDHLKTYLDEQVARRGFRDADEFLQALIEADRTRQTQREVDQMLLEATDGPFEEWTDADVNDIRRTGDQIIERTKGH